MSTDAQRWSLDERRFKEEVVSEIYTGVNTNDSDLVSDALLRHERWARFQGLHRGLLIGLFVGGVLGALSFYLGQL